MFQIHTRSFLHSLLGSMFPIHKQQHSKYNFYNFLIYLQTKVSRTE
jgi:hypothetical protein